MVGPVPTSSTLVSERPDHVVAPGYMELSGTSFAAPVVAGAAAQIFARHPNWTPDQVKGALMVTAMPLPSAVRGSLGVGGINAYAAAARSSAPNPNLALRKYVNSSGSGSELRFDAAAWLAAVRRTRPGRTLPGPMPRGQTRRGVLPLGPTPRGPRPPGRTLLGPMLPGPRRRGLTLRRKTAPTGKARGSSPPPHPTRSVSCRRCSASRPKFDQPGGSLWSCRASL